MSDKPRRARLFATARQTTFANVCFAPHELLELRPGWTEAQAAAFLKKVEVQVAAHALAAGWAAIVTLLDQTDEDNHIDGDNTCTT